MTLIHFYQKDSCWLCGRVHEGACTLDDEYWAMVEANRLKHEARNTCDLCHKFSPKSEPHATCMDAEQAWFDQERYA